MHDPPAGPVRRHCRLKPEHVEERAMRLGFLTDGRGADVQFAAREAFECLELALFGDTPLFEDHHAFKLMFAFYNCHWENVVDRPSAWERVLPEFPGVGIKFDPSHPIQAGRDWKAELLAAGPYLLHTPFSLCSPCLCG